MRDNTICEITQSLKNKPNIPSFTLGGICLDELDSRILDVLTEKKKIHYLHLAVEVGTSSETARRRAVMLALTYPKNIKYHKGTIELLKPLELTDLSPEARMEAMSKTIETQQQLIKRKEEIEKKLKQNHLPHLERALLNKNLEKAIEELQKLKRLYGEK